MPSQCCLMALLAEAACLRKLEACWLECSGGGWTCGRQCAESCRQLSILHLRKQPFGRLWIQNDLNQKRLLPAVCLACPQDLDRAAVVYANAVIILAPKFSDQPVVADRCTAMMTLVLGQHLADTHALMQQQVVHAPHRLWRWLRHGKVSHDGTMHGLPTQQA